MSAGTISAAQIAQGLPSLHRSLIDILSVLNSPERDTQLLEAAGLSLERALFPLLVAIERLGPIGVVDLAGRIGRDHTTVSRQVARLETLGLVRRHVSPDDRRVRMAAIAPAGRAAIDAVDAAREGMAAKLFSAWAPADFEALTRLMRRFADELSNSRGV